MTERSLLTTLPQAPQPVLAGTKRVVAAVSGLRDFCCL
jgi:hypothetical protein